MAKMNAEAQINPGPNNADAGTYSSVTAGDYNVVEDSHSLIGAGLENLINCDGSTGNNVIGGGEENAILGEGFDAFIGAGRINTNLALFASIVGGEQNKIKAGADDSFIGGGAENLIDTGAYTAVIGGGYENVITHHSSVIGGGYENHSGGIVGTISGGYFNTNLGINGTIGGGKFNLINSDYSTIHGGIGAVTSLYGQSAYASGGFAVDTKGEAQTSLFVARNVTVSSAPTNLFLNGSSAQMVLGNGTSWTFDILVVGRSTGGNSASYQLRGGIENVSGTTALVGSVVKDVLGEDVGGWDVSATADDGTEALVITVTGDNTNIRWVATVRTVEVKN